MSKLKVLPLGGLGEIGMNCMVLEWDRKFVLIDCGIQFPDATYPGVDLLTPDLSYVKERRSDLLGVIVTHAHDDHIGAIPYLAKDCAVDIYCTPFPRGLLENKFSEHSDTKEIRYHEIVPREKFTVGPFTFDPIRVQHSIIESLAFAIETPVGTIVHTGDFKHDSNEIGGEQFGFEAFEEIGKKGVRLLLSDSTNAERQGHTLSEVDISASFGSLFSGQEGRLIVALFASNIRRIENLLGIAKANHKKIAFAGRSMHSYTRLAHEQGTLTIPADTLVLLEDCHRYPDNQVIVLSTGSQAEPQSALVRIAHGTHKDFHLKKGDKIILSSRFIPGNERAITSMIDHLYRLGAEVIYEDIHQIHVSGHGFQDELMMMLDAVKPECFIPVHGEFRHLSKHSKLAARAGVAEENILVIEDGQSAELTETEFGRGEHRQLQRGVIVGGMFMEGGPEIFTQRINLSKTGIVFVSLLRDRYNLKLIAAPAVSFHGLLFKNKIDPKKVLVEAEDFVEDLYEDMARRSNLEDILRVELRRFFKKRGSHKPVVIPIVLDI